MTRVYTAVCGVILVAGAALAQQQAPEPADARQQPFRSGAHYVRVDAYPTRDGKPLLNLTADDFELLEDGKAQAIDRVEFIEHISWTPTEERRDPNSQRDGFELARNPNYRVFVLYFNAYHLGTGAAHRLNIPVREMLNRMMGPKDLFGILTPAQTVKDLLLGQQTQMIEDQLQQPFWEVWGRQQTPGEMELEAAFPRDREPLVFLQRLDKVYSDLESLVDVLGALREERKNIIYFADTLPSPSSRFSSMASDPRGRGNPPGVGVGSDGKLTMGSRNQGDVDDLRMNAERSRLLSIDFDRRFRDILTRARQANVSFYTVRPGGLDMSSSMLNQGTSNLAVLAEQTDGVAVLASNDLRAGVGKIADDLSSHYVLGYYTNNTKWDGRVRKITVRLKGTRQAVRARAEYRAPTEAEIAAISAARTTAAAAPSTPSAGDTAISALARLRPAARVQAYGVAVGDTVSVVAEITATEIEEGRWKQGAQVDVTLTSKDGSSTVSGRIEPGARGAVLQMPVGGQAGPWQAAIKVKGDEVIPESDTVTIERPKTTILGRPIAYRAGSAAASPFRPLATFNFRRTERVRVEWPVLQQPLESQSARLLDRTGKPLPIPIPLTVADANGRPVVTGTVSLAPLSIGDYLIEVNAGAGGRVEQQILAIRVAMAR